MKTKRTMSNRSAKALAQGKVILPTQEELVNMNEKMTLRELLALLTPTKGVKTPTAKALRETQSPIAVYSTRNFSITVYPSGFAVAKSYKRTTVVRIDACSGYKYDTAHEKIANTKKSVTPSRVASDVFLDAAWPLRIMLTAEDQLERNNDTVARNALSRACLKNKTCTNF